VDNGLHTTSTGQTIHQELIKQSCLQRILFYRFCLQRIFSIKQIFPVALLVSNNILSMGHFISVSYLVYRFIGVENNSNSNIQ